MIGDLFLFDQAQLVFQHNAQQLEWILRFAHLFMLHMVEMLISTTSSEPFISLAQPPLRHLQCDRSACSFRRSDRSSSASRSSSSARRQGSDGWYARRSPSTRNLAAIVGVSVTAVFLRSTFWTGNAARPENVAGKDKTGQQCGPFATRAASDRDQGDGMILTRFETGTSSATDTAQAPTRRRSSLLFTVPVSTSNPS